MKLVIGNLKMNLISSEINDYINYFKDKKYDNVIFAPTSIYLSRFVHNGLTSASQDVGMENSGAYTGDISPVQLLSIGVKYSLVGHSERRKYYFDSLNVAKKIKSLIDNKMIPILCIGETLSEKNDVGVEKILSEQIKNALLFVDKEKICDIIIAYEPVWSIGTGVIPTNEEIDETVSFVKSFIKKNYECNVKVLYGGSVNNNCIHELEKINSIDGYLVGGCSIKKEEFDKLINSVK